MTPTPSVDECERMFAAQFTDIICGTPPGLRREDPPKPKRRLFAKLLKRKD